ncbi:hypothetical protein GW17_00045392 [Ensete ventricosum]|nr:hypothetical protein GW17_00045392 [Ensete ventricosum]
MFTRRFAEGIRKLTGNTLGDRQKKTRRLTTRMLESSRLAGKRKISGSTREPSDYNHNTTLRGDTKKISSGFPIQIQEFYEIEDKNPLPQLVEVLGISTKPSRIPPPKLSDPPVLNSLKLLPVVAWPDCFLQPQKVEDKRVA